MQVPALIVSGYLGSGKTTLVGHLLKEAQASGVRLAIISNEFGDTGIDKALLDAGEEGLVELDGGCVCCRLSDALGETVARVLTTVKPDRLVLETSGVALPSEVRIQFWRPPIEGLVSDEAVVVLVDAERLLSLGEPDETFLDQVEAADLLVLNKCDLVDEAGLVAAEQRLAELSPGVDVVRAVRSVVDPAALFPPDPDAERLARRDPAARHSPHSHERFGTEVFDYPPGVSGAAVVAQLTALAAIRTKGFVQTDAGVRLVQGVGARIELTEPPIAPPPELVGKVVVIRREEGVDRHDR